MISRLSPFIAVALIALTLTLGLPSAASAGTPSALTFDTYSTGATTATVEGLVDANGESTTYAAQYDVATSPWCTSGGTSGSPASATAGTDPIAPDDSVAVDLSGLSEGTDYCAQLVATNGSGGADGGQVEWTQGAPTADTFDVVPPDTGTTTATLEGDVNPGGNDTTYAAEYDLVGSAWCASGGTSGSPAGTTSPAPLGTTDGSTFHDVSVELSGLSPGSFYCGQIVATNADGTGEGGQVIWTQLTLPLNFTLTIALIGNGSGTVTSSPAGLDCGAGGGACSATFPEGTPVTLTATPAAGSIFPGWLIPRGCSGTGTCTISPELDSTLNVAFTRAPPPPPQPALTVYLAGYGSGTVTSSPAGIDCGDTCTTPFAPGTEVTLTATPDHGSYFLGWSNGACSGTGTCTVTIASDQTVTAAFRPFPLPRCTVKSTRSKVELKGSKAGLLTLKVTCNQAVSFSLAGKVTIKTRIGHKTKTSHALLKSVHGSAKPGVARKVTMKVPKVALTRLEQHAAESVAFTLVAKTPNNNSRATASIKHLHG
jgi:hypothetical protein